MLLYTIPLLSVFCRNLSVSYLLDLAYKCRELIVRTLKVSD